ncbi:hypothetical protein [Vibrio methylphosphonaticus]|uniref:hypothetical protein n=1 Tax=Vibrio methylphosphonaticus TaxID=2946866 RepID=UPI00202A3DD3|nr:hypothetical protein [Vibrio methylphosphonaticus]MCL9774114.1 hypothetical protein [Vibrio methylphosphonaticus]
MSKSLLSFVLSFCVVVLTSFGVTASENIASENISSSISFDVSSGVASGQGASSFTPDIAQNPHRTQTSSQPAHPMSTHSDDNRIKAILSNLRWISNGNEPHEFESANFGVVTEVGDAYCCFKAGLITDIPLSFANYYYFHINDHRVSGWKDSNTFYVALNGHYA